MLLLFELGGYVLKGAPAPVFDRNPGADGMVTGSLGAFLVLEAAETAKARGAVPKAKLSAIAASRARRVEGAVMQALATGIGTAGDGTADCVVSGACGVAGLAAEEQAALASAAAGARIIPAADLAGHAIEASFPFAVALTAALVAAGDSASVLATSVGHMRGEGVARISRA
jgi:3-oxoacyl-[acyl-carrier-protein] synthase II